MARKAASVLKGLDDDAVHAKPVVKWAGGKSRLLPELLARMPATYSRYYEPFAGGAALFFRLAPEHAVINDLNEDLANLYRALVTDVESVIKYLEQHRDRHCEDYYYAMRTCWNDRDVTWDSAADRAAAFVYLNKTCFNGLWRVNKSGEFNVPMGRYVKPSICDARALRAAGAALARATIRSEDYRTAVDDAKHGDFIYFDPPYVPVTQTADFTTYTPGGFGARQQQVLADTANLLVASGCKVMLSNSDTPLVREMYRGFQIDTVRCSRAINSDKNARGEVDEVIITGGYKRP